MEEEKEMTHYWVPCRTCSRSVYQGLGPGPLAPTTATCRHCAGDGSQSVTLQRGDLHKRAPLAPCCATGKHVGEVAYPDDGDEQP